MEQPTQQPSLLDKLQMIDRRILYLVLLLVVAIPTLVQSNIPNAPLPMSKDLWETIDKTPNDKIVLISSTWTRSTRGENEGQFRAMLDHMMHRHIHFAIVSFDVQGSQIAMLITEEIAKRNGYVYGTDWIHWGYQVNQNIFIKGIDQDIPGTVKKDSKLKQPVASFPVMKGINNADNIHIVVEISASGTHIPWIQFLKPGVKLGFGPTSVMAPEAIPYYQTGQLSGILWGAKGAYDYEQLNVQNHVGTYGFGRRYITPLSWAFALIIISIAVGNISMFLSRSRETR